MTAEATTDTRMINYTRWRRLPTSTDVVVLAADLLCGPRIYVMTADGNVDFNGQTLTPDEARMIGVRLIESAVLAEDGRTTRQ